MKTALFLTLIFAVSAVSACAQDESALLEMMAADCSKLQASPSDVNALQRLARYSDQTGDPELKAALYVTHTLGMMLAGNLPEPEKAAQRLKRILPDSPYLEYFQFEKYQAACPKCAGSGIGRVPCKNCKGTKKCPACKGTGVIKQISGDRDRCIYCKGSGQCPTCNGQGFEKAACEQCFGKGRVISGQLLRTAHAQLLQQTSALIFAKAQAAKGLVEFEGKWVLDIEKKNELDRRFALEQQGKGLVELDGKWMTPAERKAELERRTAEEQGKKGLVELDGKWMTQKEREAELERRAAQAKTRQAEAERKLVEAKRIVEAGQSSGRGKDADAAKARKAAGISDIAWKEMDEVYGLKNDRTELQKREFWKKYKGKKIEWAGLVVDISKTFDMVDIQVRMNLDTDMADLLLTLKKSETEKALSLSKGETVRFRGVLDNWGSIFPVALKDGEILLDK